MRIVHRGLATALAGLSILPAMARAAQPVAGRLIARRHSSGALIIDDSYNANPGSVAAAIDTLAGDAASSCGICRVPLEAASRPSPVHAGRLADTWLTSLAADGARCHREAPRLKRGARAEGDGGVFHRFGPSGDRPQ